MALLRSILLPLLVSALCFHAVLSNDVSKKSANVDALLKHLTPIAGTNLFLNTPYKWHDRTMPGCYATWFKEKYADYSDKYPGVSFVCNKNDQQWYDTADASWVFERAEGEESLDQYSDRVKIKNLGAGLTLECWKSSGTWWVGLGGYAANPGEDMWYVRSSKDNKNNLQLDIQNWFIAQSPYGNHRAYVYLQSGNEDNFRYSFHPDMELEARMYDFKFNRPMEEQISRYSSSQDLIDSYDINNDSPGSVTRTVRVSEKITDEFSWGFSESLKIFSKVSGSAGVPLVASSTVEAGFELTVAANQNWKNSVEKMFELSYTVNAPAHTNVRVAANYQRIKGIQMDYKATTEITGHSNRITVFDDVVKDQPATGKAIRNQLLISNFDGKIVEIKENSVIVEIEGTLTASVGVKGQLNVDGKTVAVQSVPK